MNREAVLPVLRDLVRQPFFRYFKVNLFCDCPFWPDDGMCMLRDCSVCPCEDHEVPAPWIAADIRGASTPGCEGARLAAPSSLVCNVLCAVLLQLHLQPHMELGIECSGLVHECQQQPF